MTGYSGRRMYRLQQNLHLLLFWALRRSWDLSESQKRRRQQEACRLYEELRRLHPHFWKYFGFKSEREYQRHYHL